LRSTLHLMKSKMFRTNRKLL